MNELETIKAKMFEAAEVCRGGDREDGHSDADNTLIELVRLLSGKLGGEVPERVDDILDLYSLAWGW